MMDDKSTLYLLQILDAINKIQTTSDGLGAAAYHNHEIKWVVERGLEIIGEAIKRLKDYQPELDIPNAQKIIATRNKIAHEYEMVDPDILYSIVNRHLPLLKDFVTQRVQ